MRVACFSCGQTVNKPPTWVKRTNRHFCSKKCHDVCQTKRVTKICKECQGQFNVRPSEEHRITTCSKECQRAGRRKDKNSNWRGGVTRRRKADLSTKEYRNWRKVVLHRDDYACVFCGSRNDLNVDHIKPWAYFPELRYDLSNGRVLCLKCHKTTYKDVFKWRERLKTPENSL